MKKVSIITVVLNGASTISDCVLSVRGQTYPLIEHIIVDGGSVDGTTDRLDELGASYVSGKDVGIYDAMNKGIALAGGDIIGILNCDDRYSDSNIIERVVEAMSASGCDLCHGKVALINGDGSQYAVIGVPQSPANLLGRMRIAHPSVFVRRVVYEKFGGFSVGFKIAADYDFLLRVFPKVHSTYLDEVLVLMGRQGISSTAARRSRREAMAAALLHGRSPVRALIDYWRNGAFNAGSRVLRRLVGS